MTRDQFFEWTAKLKYKKGWEFIPSESNLMFWLTVKWRAQNARVPYDFEIGVSSGPNHMDHSMDENNFLREVRHIIHRCELHEADEFLWYDDKALFYPHVDIIPRRAVHGGLEELVVQGMAAPAKTLQEILYKDLMP